jgi:uncharacterized protein (TIGR02118 family)
MRFLSLTYRSDYAKAKAPQTPIAYAGGKQSGSRFLWQKRTYRFSAMPAVSRPVPLFREKEDGTMIKVSVFYPNKEGSKFDMGYYLNKHIPMVQKICGPSLKGGSVEQGLSGPEPGSQPAFVAMAHLLFDSVEAFQSAFGAHADSIMTDITNYTDIQPILLISEVKG